MDGYAPTATAPTDVGKATGIAMPPHIRRIRAGEGLRLRALRLHALTEAPSAFSSTFAREQAFPDELWHERAAGAAEGCERATFIAECNGQWAGLATGLRDPEEVPGSGNRLLVGMYVDRTARRLGIAGALIEGVVTWARACGADYIVLWVTSGNDPAVALYARHGFRLTGVTKPLPHTPTLADCEMIRDLR